MKSCSFLENGLASTVSDIASKGEKENFEKRKKQLEPGSFAQHISVKTGDKDLAYLSNDLSHSIVKKIYFVGLYRLRNLQQTRKIRGFSHERECTAKILDFISTFIRKIWLLSLEASFKRVDCPPNVFLPLLVNDVSFISNVEALKSLRENEISRFKKIEGAAARCSATGPSTTSTQEEKPRTRPETPRSSRKRETCRREPRDLPERRIGDIGDNSCFEVLKEHLGLQRGSFFGKDLSLDSRGGQKSQSAESSSSRIFNDKFLQETAALKTEENAVRRKQRKLTREVTVEDILTVFKLFPERLPMPNCLRLEILRYLEMSVIPRQAGGPLERSSVSDPHFLLGWKAISEGRYIRKPSFYRAPRPENGSIGGPLASVRRRVPDVWNEIVQEPLPTPNIPGQPRRNSKRDSIWNNRT